MDRQTLGEMDLPAHIWEPFAQSRAAIRCSPGFLIYLQGTEATCFYYLKEGRVKSFIQSETGDERVLNIYRAGSLFGEASFLDELPREVIVPAFNRLAEQLEAADAAASLGARP